MADRARERVKVYRVRAYTTPQVSIPAATARAELTSMLLPVFGKVTAAAATGATAATFPVYMAYSLIFTTAKEGRQVVPLFQLPGASGLAAVLTLRLSHIIHYLCFFVKYILYDR